MNKMGSFKIKNKHKKATAWLLFIVLIFMYSVTSEVIAKETPEAVYNGTTLAKVMLNNLSYTDVKKASNRIKLAVYETEALGIVKNVNGKTLGLNTLLTREEAIVAVYRLVGREAEAQQAAEVLAAADAGTKKKAAQAYWADGAFKLALDDGLITQAQYDDALAAVQTTLTASGYNRKASIQRQELAFWLALAMKIPPIYDQQKIFNSYKDWGNVDPEKIPNIEAVLRSTIMSGDDNGYFYPNKDVNRGDFAQIAKNAEAKVLPTVQIVKKTGTIEDKKSSKVVTAGKTTSIYTYNVRNSGGGLDNIVTKFPKYISSVSSNENNGKNIALYTKELVVYKNGTIGKSSLLKVGDRIEYTMASDNTVKFVNVISSIVDTKYIAAQINSLNMSSLSMSITKLFDMSYPDLDSAKKNIFFTINEKTADESYKYSKNVLVMLDNIESDIQSIQPDANAILTIKNGIITGISLFEFESPEESGIIDGIVEENNPQLGYLSLYNEDGSGTEPYDQLRIYNYSNQNDIEVFKNHKNSILDNIDAGDTVFIKLDENDEIISVSAVDNYIATYGKVLSKGPSMLVIKYDNGAEQVLDVDSNSIVINNKKIVNYSNLSDGDRVKLLLNITPLSTTIKEITIEGDEHFITDIYKGTVSYINETSNTLLATNMEVLKGGKWNRTDIKGVTGIKLSPECQLFYNNELIDLERANKYFNQNEAYVAVEKDYDGSERVAVISFRNEEDGEDVPYDDSIVSTDKDLGEFSLSSRDEIIKYGEGTIMVLNGRLVKGNSLSEEDLAYVVANRSYESGDYYAGVVQISERSDIEFAQIYRARISKIDENRSFTVQSYSQLKGGIWSYLNTPKTFKLSGDTRIVDDNGVVNQRGFADYGSSSYKDRTVYIVAQNTETLLVSTAPYGVYIAKGVIYDISDAVIGEEGTVLSEPTGIKLTDTQIFDTTNFIWNDSIEMTLSILNNSIILKDNKIAKPSDLEKGDLIRVLKKDDTETGDVYIIIVD